MKISDTVTGCGSSARTGARRFRKAAVFVGLFTAFVAGAPMVHGAESIIPVTPPGSTDVDQALLPPPGFSGALVSLPYNRNQNTFDSNGNRLPAALNLKVNTNAPSKRAIESTSNTLP